ncbi:MAG: iron-containing alcohol dehydrogenase [Clostridia bacterium]
MFNYLFYNRTKILAGDKALENITYELKCFACKRPLVITEDVHLKLGYLKVLLKAFDNDDISIPRIYTKVGENAEIKNIDKLVSLYKENNCDSIVALGGEASIATAKAVKLVIKQKVESINDFIGKNIAPNTSAVPLIVVPVGLGSGFEAADFAVVYDGDKSTRYELRSSELATNSVILDKRMIDSMPPALVSTKALYAISMAVWAFTSSQTNPVARCYAESSLNLLKTVKMTVKTPNNRNMLLSLLNAVVLAGVAFHSIQRGVLCSLASAISKFAKIEEDRAMAIIFPQLYNVVYPTKQNADEVLMLLTNIDTYVNVPKEERAQKAVEEIKSLVAFFENEGYYKFNLRDIGIKQEDLPVIAEAALKNIDIQNDREFDFNKINSILNNIY